MKKARILIVEDEVLIAEDLKSCLEFQGYEVLKPVESGEAALEMVTSEPIDLILMDILLKGVLSGIETVHEIQNHYDIPTIYLTSHSDKATLEAAKKTEPFGYILKPFNDQELFGAIELALYKHEVDRKYRDSMNQFKYIYNNATIGIYRTTPDGQILMANPALVEMLGYDSLEDLQKRNLEKNSFHPNYPRDKIKKKLEIEGHITGWEDVWIRKDGTYLYIRENSTAIRDDFGNVLYYEGTVEDVTERKLLQKKFEEDEYRFRVISELSTDFVFTVHLNKESSYIAPEEVTGDFTRITGIPLADVNTPEKMAGFVHPDDLPLFFKMSEIVEQNKPVQDMVRLVGKDKGVIWIYFSLKPVWDATEKRVTRIIGAGKDMTREKMMEAHLKESEEQYRDLVEKANIAIIIDDMDGNILFANQNFADIYGYNRDEVIGRSLQDIVYPDDLEYVRKCHFDRIEGIDSPVQYEFRGIKKNGDVIHLAVKANVFRKEQKIVGTRAYLWDVTEHKQAENQLEESEARFRMLYEGMPLGYQAMDENGNLIEVNDMWCQKLGYSRDEVLNKPFQKFVAPDVVESYISCFKEIKKTGKIDGQQISILHKDKTVLTVSYTGNASYDIHGKMIEAHCIFTDITELKKIENALRDSEEKYKKLFHENKDGVVLSTFPFTGKDGHFIEINHAFCQLVHYKSKELLRMSPLKLVLKSEYKLLSDVESKLGKGKSALFEVQVRTRSGKFVPVEVNVRLIELAGKKAALAVVRNIHGR